MTTSPNPLLRANLKSLRLPTMLSEHDKLARDAAASNQTFEDYLLRLTELELAARSAHALTARIKNAGFPVLEALDSSDFSALPTLSKPKILELARWPMDPAACQLLPGGQCGHGQNPPGHQFGFGRLP